MSTRSLDFPAEQVGTIEEIHSGRKLAAAGRVCVDADQPIRLLLERQHRDVLAALAADDVQSLYLGGKGTLKSGTIAALGRLSGLVELYAPCKGAWDDDACEAIAGLTKLRGLSILRAHGVTDEGFLRLADLSELMVLRIEQARITSRALTALAGMSKLSELMLSYCRALDDEGLRIIGRQEALTRLDLDGTAVSDDGVKHLAGLSSLRLLFLGSTQGVTTAGLGHLPRNDPPIRLATFSQGKTALSRAQWVQLQEQHPHLDLGVVRELTTEPGTRDLVRENGVPLVGSTVTTDAPVLAIFTTDNCRPCERMLPAVAELGRQWHERMTTVHVHCPDHPDLSAALNIQSAPTLMLFTGKDRSVRLLGSAVLDELKQELAPYLGLAVSSPQEPLVANAAAQGAPG